ncbi:MAG: hypothetical protein AAF282_04300 [Cyanobacteria bacterium P01_A01_bin.15]
MASQQDTNLFTLIGPWHRAIFTRGNPLTIFTADAFHNRVRDGSEWDHTAEFRENLRELVNGLNGLVSLTDALEQQTELAQTLAESDP